MYYESRGVQITAVWRPREPQTKRRRKKCEHLPFSISDAAERSEPQKSGVKMTRVSPILRVTHCTNIRYIEAARSTNEKKAKQKNRERLPLSRMMQPDGASSIERAEKWRESPLYYVSHSVHRSMEAARSTNKKNGKHRAHLPFSTSDAAERSEPQESAEKKARVSPLLRITR